ncbi:hypothetical protein HaLaN_06835, partial [Haematococcus lacustris]
MPAKASVHFPPSFWAQLPTLTHSTVQTTLYTDLCTAWHIAQNQWDAFLDGLGNAYNQNPSATSSALAQAFSQASSQGNSQAAAEAAARAAGRGGSSSQ